MIKQGIMSTRVFMFLFLLIGGILQSTAQSDSTDLNVYMSAVELETPLDSVLYMEGDFEQLNLDFTITDTLTFESVCVLVENTTTGELIFKRVYTLSGLETAGLISDWLVSIPFGNVNNTDSYEVSVVVEDYSGALGTVITKTITP